MQVVYDGLAPFINRLEKFDKDVSKDLKSEMRSAAGEVVGEAAGEVTGVPISGWGNWTQGGRDLGYDPGAVKRGFKVAANRYRRRGVTTSFGYDVVQTNAGGNVFEVIGDKSRVSGPQGSAFVDSVVRASGRDRSPRTLYTAYYAVIGRVQARMQEAVESAMRKVGL